MTRYLATIMAVVLATTVATASPQSRSSAAQQYPDVVGVQVQARGGNRFDFGVTISSPYDTPQRYADAFRVMSAAGQVFDERKLLHDHADEQPFTRDLYGVSVPTAIRVIVVQARDQKFGYGGKTVRVALPGR
jgi:hypothetical protein